MDKYQIFHEPVNAEEVPDYYDVIKHPMSFSQMRGKLKSGAYKSIQQFAVRSVMIYSHHFVQEDLDLIVNNATTYNKPSTIFYKEAKKLKWIADKFLEKLERSDTVNVDAMQEDAYCSRCKEAGNGGKIVICDGCDRNFHTHCLAPPLNHNPKEEFFFCSR